MTFFRLARPAPLGFALALLAAAPLSAAVSIVTTSLPSATVGVFYSTGFTVSGGVQPYSWSATGNLPPGLSVSSGGSIIGTPTSAGSFSFTLSVRDAQGANASRFFTIAVSGPSLTIKTASPLPAGSTGQPYSVSFSVASGSPPYRWTAGTGLPPGLTLDANTGALSGTPAAGVFTFSVQVTDSAQATASANFSLTIAASPLTITTAPPLFTGTVGIAYSQPLSAAGGKMPYTWTIASGNTDGLTLDSATATLRGTPQAAGSFDLVVRVIDSTGASASKLFTLVVNPPVLTILVSGTLPAGAVGVPYSQKLPVAATGATPPFHWTASSLPPGLSFSGDELTISGTPTDAGTFTFTVQASDSTGHTGSRQLSLMITPPALTITTGRQLPDGSLKVRYSTSLAAIGGSQPYTWSAAGLPAGLSIDASSGVISGTPTAGGPFAIAITVSDSALTRASDRFTLNISLPPAPAVSVSGLPATANAASQYPIQVTLASAFPAPITGQAVLTFSPESGPADKTVQFASGGTTSNFSIPAGATTPAGDVPLAIQTGTVAGTIGVSIRLQAGGVDITPAPAPAVSAAIGRAAPVITDVTVTRAAGTLMLSVSGYSTSRAVTQATFTFAAVSGQTLQSAASSLRLSVEPLFSAWFQDPANGTYGSQFVLNQPFMIQGDSNAVLPQSVTLINSLGSVTYELK